MDTLKNQIIDLYKRYGFHLDKDNGSFLIMTRDDGYFENAEFVYLSDEGQIKGSCEISEYREIGYSVHEKRIVSYDKAHEELFQGFFHIRSYQESLRQEYETFARLQSKKMLDTTYEYIEPNYIEGSELKDSGLIKSILRHMGQKGKQLIIVEAAAGYGKTCTSYELLHYLKIENGKKLPLFTELSKNRRASLFRYVLLDESEKRFKLPSSLVRWEIENGNIPLIIDGFDELLSVSTTNTDDQQDHDDSAQSMLDTIAELFGEESNATVVLTSRKSSLLTGDRFDEWEKTHLDNCTITRFSIEEPTIEAWIGNEKYNYLVDSRIPLESILNPILLSYMRNLDVDVFREQFKSSKDAVDCYFTFLLERERQRQELQLTVEEQYSIMTQFAQMMTEFDINSEEYDFIKSLFVDIVKKRFSEYIERYVDVEARPSLDSFAAKLAGHALLNRISPVKNEIGFINAFIFGNFIGEAIVNGSLKPKDISRSYIEISATAMSSQNYEKIRKYYSVIKDILPEFNAEQQLDIEIKLLETIDHDYNNVWISNRSFNDNIAFWGDHVFHKCMFRNCIFNHCTISVGAFKDCSFYNCKFYDPLIDKDVVGDNNLFFDQDCIGYDALLTGCGDVAEPVEGVNYEIELLKRFQKGQKLGLIRIEDVLLKTPRMDRKQLLEEAMLNLKQRGFLYKEGHYWNISKEHIVEIKEMLGILNNG